MIKESCSLIWWETQHRWPHSIKSSSFIFYISRSRSSRSEVFCRTEQALICNIIKKETLAQLLSCEFCEIFKNIFFKEHLWWLLLQKHLLSLTVIFVQKIKGINWFRSEIDDLKVNSCRFGNLSIFSDAYKNNTLKILHSQF